MTITSVQRQQEIEWGVASRALPGQLVSGDLHFVARREEGWLAAVVDGLGHGEEATAAARLAVTVMTQHIAEPVARIVRHCHQALLRTRGVVMTLVGFDPLAETLTMLGIGNVETVLFRRNPRARPSREHVLLRSGVVGYRLPALEESVVSVAPDDLVVFATDGVREDFADVVSTLDTPQAMAEKVLARKFRGNDDGLVLACKYVGKP